MNRKKQTTTEGKRRNVGAAVIALLLTGLSLAASPPQKEKRYELRGVARQSRARQ
jgi:hypothetical protein